MGDRPFDRRNFIRFGIGALGGLSIFGLRELIKRNESDGKDKVKKDYNSNNDSNNDSNKGSDKNKGEKDLQEKDLQDDDKDIKKINDIHFRKLGKTGLNVSLIGLGSGAGAIPQENGATEEDAYELINTSLNEGINYIDTAPSYANGLSEENIGEVMKTRRDETILATKTQRRDYDGVMREIEASLNRLKTDYIDIYQLHGLSNLGDVTSVLSENGAVKALDKLRAEGVIKYTGVTGHNDPEVLLEAIEGYEFDCLLMPLNTGDVHSKPFQGKLLERATKKEMGIIAMKVVAYGRLLREDGVDSMKRALSYVYTFPISTAILGISNLDQLKENLEITRGYEKLSKNELQELENMTVHYEYEANFFKHEW